MSRKLLRRVNEGVTDPADEMRQGKKILQSLPQNHWFLHSPYKQDRSYSIPELYQFVQDAGLHFVTFYEPLARVMLQLETYIQDQALLQKIKALSLPKQQAIAELFDFLETIKSVLNDKEYKTLSISLNSDSVNQLLLRDKSVPSFMKWV